VWTKKQLRPLTASKKWKKGDTWELSVVASNPSKQWTYKFGFAGKGGFLKFEVPPGAQQQTITVRDVVKKRGNTRFEFRGKGNVGVVSFTNICLRKVSDGPELPDTLPKPPPKEKVETPAPKGTTVLPINDAPAKNFEIGQELVLDAGTPIEEYNRVAAFGSVILEYPLEFDHSNGVEIGGVSEEEIDAEDEEDPSSSVQEEKEEKVKEEAQAGGGEDSAPGGGEDSAPAGGDIAVGGATATLDAAGFLATTSLCCPVEMEAFFNRLLDKMGLDVCSKPHVQGLMHWFHCVPNMDFQYMIDVINNGNPCKYWGPKGQECPVLSPECDGRWCR